MRWREPQERSGSPGGAHVAGGMRFGRYTGRIRDDAPRSGSLGGSLTEFPGLCSGPESWILTGESALVSPEPIDRRGDRRGDFRRTLMPWKRSSGQRGRAFCSFREIPAPKRGELVRDLGNALREDQEPLGELISLEAGEDPGGGLGRSPGDDRHLRLRSGGSPASSMG